MPRRIVSPAFRIADDGAQPSVMIERAASYRAALADVDAAIAENATLAAGVADRKAGKNVGYAVFAAITDISTARSAARRLKVHSTRVKRLVKLAADIRSGAY